MPQFRHHPAAANAIGVKRIFNFKIQFDKGQRAMSNELIVLQPAQYPALDPNNDRIKLMMQNLGGESLGVADFTRIKVPAQGGTKWSVETAEGEKLSETIEGVILYSTRRRAYWSNPNPSQTPPDCQCIDLTAGIGIGTPGGHCDACPFNQFGSAKNGHGKACRETRILFLLRAGQVLPDVVSAPPGSLRNMKDYILAVSKDGLPYFGVVTQLSLEAANSRDGTKYSKIKAKSLGKLDAASYERIVATIRQYESTFQSAASSAAFDADDASSDEPQEV